MGNNIHKIGASHDGDEEEVIFQLRGISVAEETRYTNRYAQISDLDSEEKRSEKEYEILVDSLANWSDQPPIIKKPGQTLEEATEASKTAGTPADGVRAYFAEKTINKERTAQQVMLQFRRKLQPKVVFY